MADTYVARRDFTLGDKHYKKGDIVSWPDVASTGVFKRLMSRRVVRRIRTR